MLIDSYFIVHLLIYAVIDLVVPIPIIDIAVSLYESD